MNLSCAEGVRPKAWFRPSNGGSTAGNESHTGQTKYAIPETAHTNLGKAWQFYGESSPLFHMAHCAEIGNGSMPTLALLSHSGGCGAPRLHLRLAD